MVEGLEPDVLTGDPSCSVLGELQSQMIQGRTETKAADNRSW